MYLPGGVPVWFAMVQMQLHCSQGGQFLLLGNKAMHVFAREGGNFELLWCKCECVVHRAREIGFGSSQGYACICQRRPSDDSETKTRDSETKTRESETKTDESETKPRESQTKAESDTKTATRKLKPVHRKLQTWNRKPKPVDQKPKLVLRALKTLLRKPTWRRQLQTRMETAR